ncbi:aldehyde dehydrogenase [SAR202 cluster bacterium AD-804-J14_MRT_500m]|nr:aldehyde dehydrogenase [SAR202 cluster bacterium AD-804-J14_MRT_500m]
MTPDRNSLVLPLETRLIIDGKEGAASDGRTFERENPANANETVTVSARATVGDARAAVDAARRAFDNNTDNWLHDYKLRERVLYRTAQLMRENAQQLAAVVSLEVGMPIRQALPHVSAAADVFEYYAGMAGKMYGESFFLANGSMINLIKEPIGVVGLITPWNFPLTQTARKLAPALAVGCTVIVKPASYTPAATYELMKLVQEAGAPNGVSNYVAGPGAVVGDELVQNPKIDKVSFTGETEIGKGIAARAAMDVKRLSLELGGKAPYVVFEDSDLDAAAMSAIFGMFRNAGQACGATTRLIVQESIHDVFLEKVVALGKRLQVGDPALTETDMGPIISKSQKETIMEFIRFGQDAGYPLVLGGGEILEGPLANGYYLEPTIFDNVDNGSRLGQEEIFGPVVAVMSFNDEEEAVQLSNDVPFGLVAGVWSGDYVRAMRVARRIRAGTVWIWDNYTQPVEGIWGGFKQSGIGRELGPYGLDDFIEIKQIYTDGTGDAKKPAYRSVIKD